MKKAMNILLIIFSLESFAQVDFQNTKELVQDNIENTISDLETISEDSLIAYQNKVLAELEENGSVIISKEYAKYLERFNLQDPPKVVIGNLYVTVPGNNNPTSFQYEVNKGDIFYFSFKNNSNKNLSALEIIEGEEVRFLAKNISKKEPIESSFTVQNDGIVSINLTNKFFLKASGQLMVWLKKKKIELEVLLKRDTVLEIQQGLIEIRDTVFVPIMDEQITVHSKLDLTHSNKYQKALNFPTIQNLSGWVYWVGETNSALKQLQNRYNLEIEDPLYAYALGNSLSLPSEDNLDISWVFQNKKLSGDFLKGKQKVENGFKTMKGDSNGHYGYAKGPFPEGLYFACMNQSNLYDYSIYLKIAGIVINVNEEDGEIEVPIVNEFYEVTIK